MNFNCEFSLQHYLSVLNDSKDNFFIAKLGNFDKIKTKKKIIFLRHDVDFSLEYALDLAVQESKNFLNSTYFVLTHSDFYNVMSKHNSNIINKIIDLGHEVGLHYDTSFLPDSNAKQLKFIKDEVAMLEKITGSKIKSVSSHIPSETLKIKVNLEKSGFIDSTYSSKLKTFKYISDSDRYWREKCMCKNIGKYDRLQILTHPIWWIRDGKSRNGVLEQLKMDQIKKIDFEIIQYKKMVDRLLISLNAPRSEFS